MRHSQNPTILVRTSAARACAQKRAHPTHTETAARPEGFGFKTFNEPHWRVVGKGTRVQNVPARRDCRWSPLATIDRSDAASRVVPRRPSRTRADAIGRGEVAGDGHTTGGGGAWTPVRRRGVEGALRHLRALSGRSNQARALGHRRVA